MKWLPFGEILIMTGVGALLASLIDVISGLPMYVDFLLGLAIVTIGLEVSRRHR